MFLKQTGVNAPTRRTTSAPENGVSVSLAKCRVGVLPGAPLAGFDDTSQRCKPVTRNGQ
jgi:hypothetical protein